MHPQVLPRYGPAARRRGTRGSNDESPAAAPRLRPGASMSLPDGLRARFGGTLRQWRLVCVSPSAGPLRGLGGRVLVGVHMKGDCAAESARATPPSVQSAVVPGRPGGPQGFDAGAADAPAADAAPRTWAHRRSPQLGDASSRTDHPILLPYRVVGDLRPQPDSSSMSTKMSWRRGFQWRLLLEFEVEGSARHVHETREDVWNT